MNDIGGIVVLAVVAGLIIGVVYMVTRPTITKYCRDCERNITPKKDFNWLVFIFLCGLCYIPFYMTKEERCPICNGTNFTSADMGKPKM